MISKKERLKEIKAQKIELLKLKKQIRRDNLIEFFEKPIDEDGMPANPLQAELLEAWQDPSYKTYTYTGGNRTGKTTIGVIVSISTIFGKWPWNNQKLFFPHSKPRKVRIIGQDWEKHISQVLIPELKKWWPKNRQVVTKKNNTGVEALWMDVKTGGTIEIMSNNQESELHEGWQGDLVYYDEPPRREIRVANARGLVDREGKELFCMTLLKEAWVDRDVIKARLDDGRPDPSVFNVHGTIYDNIGYGLTQKGVDQFAKLLSPEEKDARLRGIPSYMSGLVCPKFTRRKHIIDRFDVPLDWIVDIAFDIHPRTEQAVLFVATSPKNERFACFEIYTHADGTTIAENVIRLVQRNVLRVGRCICDPLAKGDRNSQNTTFDKIDMVLNRYGYVLDVASKDKESGIIEINKHLMGPNKEPSLFFFSDLKRTIWEIEGWMYDEDTQKPKKRDDHMCENLYRILLENTVYYPPEDEEEDDYTEYHSTANQYTGY